MDEHTKTAESALAAQTKKQSKPKDKKKNKAQLDIICANCIEPGHRAPDCYSKEGGKEGQGPQQRKKAKEKESKMAVVAADDEENKLFTFTCMSDYVAIVNGLDIPKSRLGTCIDSSASRDYCPDCAKFLNYKEIKQKITTADGQTLSATKMGDLHIELPNVCEKTKNYPQKCNPRTQYGLYTYIH